MSRPQIRTAVCHPLRRAVLGSFCRECITNRGVSKPVDSRPPRIQGAEQRVTEYLPTTCPKCQAGSPAWEIGEAYARCRICGMDVYKASGRTITREQALGEHRGHQPGRVRQA